MKNFLFIVILALTVSIVSCKDDDDDNTHVVNHAKLIFVFQFDSTQVRLDNFGNPSALPANHGGQSPKFNKMSAHYIEMSPNALTMLGDGEVVYHNEETTLGGATAIDFSKSNPVGNGQEFFSIPLHDVTPGSYEWLRVSLAYQNYDVNFRVNISGTNYDLIGSVASFIGYNTHITSHKVKDSTIVLNANRQQGYWAFETIYNVAQGQAPPGATTVPNPIFSTSPIPQGSCVVTSEFTDPLIITGNETSDVIVTVKLSTNKSFEWVEHSAVGFYEPAAGDTVVDMGIRGMVVSH